MPPQQVLPLTGFISKSLDNTSEVCKIMNIYIHIIVKFYLDNSEF